MRSSKPVSLFLLVVILGLLASCGGGGGGGGDSDNSSSSSSCSTPAAIALPNGSTVTQAPAANVMTLTVNGSTCSPATSASYPNKPCVTVTICDANGNNCSQPIDDILLDTGDNGLRIFQDAPGVANSALLTSLLGQNSSLYECVEYGDGSTVWGPVVNARVTLGGESAVQVPIQLVGSALFSPSTYCAGSPILSSYQKASYNGSLGLGIYAQDCGLACQTGSYYTCSLGTCTNAPLPVAGQVANPVASLPVDNNGVIVSLPSVPSTGSPSATGYVILGIGTQLNNAPSGVTAYGITPSGYFGYINTTFNSVLYGGFLDSGSNGFFFTYSTTKTTNGDWYAPSCTVSLSATNTGASAPLNSNPVAFNIADANSLFNTSNYVFSDLGGPLPGGGLFDWGIPFFLGRNVYIGIDGRLSLGLATGPFWAY